MVEHECSSSPETGIWIIQAHLSLVCVRNILWPSNCHYERLQNDLTIKIVKAILKQEKNYLPIKTCVIGWNQSRMFTLYILVLYVIFLKEYVPA